MFAVKGWNVDASSLKPQTEVVKSAAKTDRNGEKKQGKKRKRGDVGAAQDEDVGKLWDQHIEGKEPVKSKQGQKKQKKQKVEQGGRGAGAGKDEGKAKVEKKNSQDHAELGATDEDKQKKEMKERKKERKEKNREKKRSGQQPPAQDGAMKVKDTQVAAPPPVPALPSGTKLTPMQSAMRQKLISARFRHLNQTLYTEPSSKALDLFDQNPEMFEDYHSGFRQQVAVWPENPVDNFISTIQSRGKVRLHSQKKAFKDKKRSNTADSKDDATIPALPRTHGTCTIADLGCGDARLAHTLKSTNSLQNLQVKVLSYDLHSPSPLVTKADISNVPAVDGSVDVAIFCLALMGTNWISFIEEAYRILHWKGELWVSEIKSRFGRVGGGKPKVVEHSVGGKRKLAALKKAQEAKQRDAADVNEQEALAVEVDGVETQNQETDVSGFVDVLRRRGFLLKDGEKSIDLSNKMFVKMEFVKAAQPVKGKNAEKDGERKPVERFRKPKAKFLDEKDPDDVSTDDEGKVLKPCLYKIR
ncbi:hypothetical protein M409DRAFT_25175 [Zasmidium cellare ATCC 36951]|uniref:Ribosomal RNA-processing protein 8 n=1 Tax=Zasmidium cellare ATCC 36951 TaxID=1080233 RepID=A0A6A6CFW0_ZASCE|nr:uncharacterized protein M409DRAFT_25175 [Zasmidium cellare ATCC 36951]KAF2164296.1 hypothetical protein M409DRAFT_25175 [Zasmidium cellare ATCC 36951]